MDDSDQERSIRERSFDHDFMHDLSDTLANVTVSQDRLTTLHERRDGVLARARHFMQHCAKQGNRLRLIEPETTREARLGKQANLAQIKLVTFAR